MAALTISDAAKVIGHSSRSQLYRLINDGRLDDFVRWQNGKRLLEVNGLAAAVRDMTQQRSNSAGKLMDNDSGTDWDGIAAVANAWLNTDAWGKPPWSGTQWATLYWCITDAAAELGVDDCAEEVDSTSTQ